MTASFVLNDGLAVYRVGAGEPALLFPYPHGSILRPMAEDKLAALQAGCYDPQTPPACALELAAGIEDAHLRILEHSGHSPFVEETECCGNEIISFLELKS